MWDKLGSYPNDFQNLNTMVTFFKNGLQLVGPVGYFWDQISESIFLFPKNYKWISHLKFKVSSIFAENGGKSNLREFLLKGAL